MSKDAARPIGEGNIVPLSVNPWRPGEQEVAVGVGGEQTFGLEERRHAEGCIFHQVMLANIYCVDELFVGNEVSRTISSCMRSCRKGQEKS